MISFSTPTAFTATDTTDIEEELIKAMTSPISPRPSGPSTPMEFPPRGNFRVLVAFLDNEDTPQWSYILPLRSMNFRAELMEPPIMDMEFIMEPLDPK